MKAKRTLIAACIAAIFASGAVLAKDKWEYNEEGWNKTRSYGSVMIGEDSVERWGPWEEFVEPAAGAPSIGFLGAGGSDPYKPIPTPIPTGCGEGDWCGYIALSTMFDGDRYGTKKQYVWPWGWKWVTDYTKPQFLFRFAAGEIALQFQPSDGPLPWGGPWDVGAVNLVLLTDLPGSPAGSETGMVPVKFFGQQGKFYEIDPNYKALDGGSDGQQWDVDNFKVNEDYITLGLLEAYVSGDGEVVKYCKGEDCTKVYAPFVAGQLTPLADMNSLNAGKFSAEYKGYTALAGGKVYMSVNFGDRTWSGNWNSGLTTGFGASGTISGANFASTKLTEGVSGSVQGSFYGPQAAALGGSLDVTKQIGKDPAANYVDVFAATRGKLFSPKVLD